MLQSILQWENPDENQKNFDAQIQSVNESVDIFVLPEMFTTGFTMNPSAVAETMKGGTLSWMQKVAKRTEAAICGSVVIEESGNFYNRLLFIHPSGEIKHYDKRHLFTLAGEDKVYKAGTQKLIINYKGFKICPLVCYDLRFPVFARNTEDYDVLLFVANWPKTRISAWDILLKARAVENMCYTIGVNRIGSDNNHHEYTGHSQVVDFLGNYVLEPQKSAGVFIVTLDKSALDQERNKLGFLNDRDLFTVLD